MVWQVVQDGEVVEIVVEEENFKQEQNYIVYPLQQVACEKQVTFSNISLGRAAYSSNV